MYFAGYIMQHFVFFENYYYDVRTNPNNVVDINNFTDLSQEGNKII